MEAHVEASAAAGPNFLFHLLKAGAVLPLAHVAGGAAQRFLLPRITGYLLTGMLAGPYLLDIINEDAVKILWPVDYLCLSIIAVAAGSELQSSELHRTRAQVSQPTQTAERWSASLASISAQPMLSTDSDFGCM
jgi:Kef-type K+ transport system membrane component KefB